MTRTSVEESTPPGGTTTATRVCELRVGGMDCPGCADDISRALHRVAGVDDVRVDVVAGSVKVRYSPDTVHQAGLLSAVGNLGYQVSAVGTRRHTFIVEGMCCAGEVRQLEAKLAPLPGVARLGFDLVGRRLTVEGALGVGDIQRAVRETGMIARVEGQATALPTFWRRRGRVAMAVASAILLAGGLATGWRGGPAAIEIALLGGAAVSAGWFVAPRAWRAASSGALDMNVLMTMATVGAFAIGEWSEGASVMFLFAVAQILETYSMDRARNAIKALMELSPAEANVRRDGQEMTVPVAEVGIGALVVVRPGQKIPLDGVVALGESSVNQAPITGESVPVDKSSGDEVFAGSLNEHGVLEILVTKLVEDTTLARIIHAVEEAQATRAPTQSFVDRFSAVYTPAVVVCAVLLIVVPPLVGSARGARGSIAPWPCWSLRVRALWSSPPQCPSSAGWLVRPGPVFCSRAVCTSRTLQQLLLSRSTRPGR